MSQQFDGGSHCYDMVVISYAGKTVQAKVTDRCERCGEHGLDFSESLFAYFAPTSDGLLWGDWEFWGIPTSSTHVIQPSSTSSSVTSADQHAPSTSLTLTFPHSTPTSKITRTFPTSPLSTTNATSYPPRPSSHFSTSSTSSTSSTPSSSPSFPTLHSHTTNPPTLIPPSISSSAIPLSTTSSSLLTKSSSITASVTIPPNTTSPLPSITGQTGSQVAHPTANRGIMFRPTLGMLSLGMCGVLVAASELL
ncbi:hypothetical protein A0H81_04505 [Grifola frondosa]|uniref:RlpA-like protein double-psi beta-barrel domain-containing protein n=1 Tax=Grifola frondosa TaxID=5627 RepID=A0A1C7MEF9_GRIFR|nr:hypothetical protein A0H81_04505 [Grifola frondosa]